MIILIGNGYLGSVFARELEERKIGFYHSPHQQVSKFWHAHTLLKDLKPELVINAAAFIPPESVKLCDDQPAETIKGNVLLPSLLANACEDQGIPLAHISTGCLWSDGEEHSEESPVQRAFTGHCGFYIGTKVLAEEAVRAYPKHYIWRVRLPYDEVDSPRNYLSKLTQFDQVWAQTNSACHRLDCVKACLDLWELRASFGTYHMTNPGVLNVADIVSRMHKMGILASMPNLIDKKDGECRLSSQKLLSTGVKIRSAEEAISDSLENWLPM